MAKEVSLGVVTMHVCCARCDQAAGRDGRNGRVPPARRRPRQDAHPAAPEEGPRMRQVRGGALSACARSRATSNVGGCALFGRQAA